MDEEATFHLHISSLLQKKWIRRKEIIAIFNFLIENVSEYEIAEAGIQQMSGLNENVCFFPLLVVD